MQCIVLAGGLATRMRPATETMPKALLPVDGVPFVDYQLSLLRAGGVSHVVFSIGYLGDMIRDHVGGGERWGIAVDYVDEGDDLRGTAGALRLACDGGRLESEFLVIYGDSYLAIDYRPVMQALQSSSVDAVMAVYRNADRPTEPSNVVFEDGQVVLYDKRRHDPRMTYIDYGVAALRRRLVETEVPAAAVADLADLYHESSRRGALGGYAVSVPYYEVGSPIGLATLEAKLRSDAAGDVLTKRSGANTVAIN